MTFLRYILILLCLTYLIGCGNSESPSSAAQREARVLFVAHYWQTAEEVAALQQAIDAFTRSNPDVSVHLQSSERFGREFESQALAGLGADMLIGLPYEQVIPLAQVGVLRDLSDLEFETSKYRNQYLVAVQYQGKVYALPFMGKTSVLFYNKDIVPTAPPNLAEVLERASEDIPLAMATNFQDAFWGTQSFGNLRLDDDGQFQVDLQSFVDWFEWLKGAQDEPGVILDSEPLFLREKFLAGEVAYLVDASSSLSDFQEALGPDKVGVAPLPDGDGGPASPLATLEVVAFNQAASLEKAEIGLRLAEFLTTSAQQRKLVLNGYGRVPVNRSVTIKPNLSETGSALVHQGATSICIPLDHLPTFEQLRPYGDEAYAEVLEGDVDPVEATIKFFKEAGLPY